MVRMQNIAAGSGLDHVGFRVSRRVAGTELRMTGGLIAVLVLAIGVCGSVLPSRSGWLAGSAGVDTMGRLGVDAGLGGDQRPASARS